MTPRGKAAIDPHANRSGHGAGNDRNSKMMAFDACALNSIQESGEPHNGLADDPVRAQPAALNALRLDDARLRTVRAGVTLVSRRIGLNYFDIWK
jgi:hypothetical protein